MKLTWEAVLDRLEQLFTKPNKKGKKKRPDWVVWMSPERSLKPEETYSRALYVRTASMPLFITLVLATTAYGIATVIAWSEFKEVYAFLQTPHHNAQGHHLVTLIYNSIFLIVVVAPSIWAAFAFAIPLPRYYFWNRRARRLRSQEPAPESSPTEILIDPAVWPPAPKRSA